MRTSGKQASRGILSRRVLIPPRPLPDQDSVAVHLPDSVKRDGPDFAFLVLVIEEEAIAGVSPDSPERNANDPPFDVIEVADLEGGNP
jgi:hypothetical protein